MDPYREPPKPEPLPRLPLEWPWTGLTWQERAIRVAVALGVAGVLLNIVGVLFGWSW